MTTLILSIEARAASIREAFALGSITEAQRNDQFAALHAEVKTMNHPELTALDMAVARLDIARLNQSNAQKEFVALLPVASESHMARIVKCVADGEDIPNGFKPNKDVRLSETQRKAVQAAQKTRSEWLTANAAAVIDEVKANAGDLTSYTIKVGSKQTTTRLVFTKSHGDKPQATAAGKAIAANYMAVAVTA